MLCPLVLFFQAFFFTIYDAPSFWLKSRFNRIKNAKTITKNHIFEKTILKIGQFYNTFHTLSSKMSGKSLRIKRVSPTLSVFEKSFSQSFKDSYI